MATGRKDYDKEKQKIKDFVELFYVSTDDGDGGMKQFPYMEQISNGLALREQVALYVHMDHVVLHDPELADSIKENAKRYSGLFAECIDDFIQERLEGTDPPVKDALDAFIYQRLLMAAEVQNRDGDAPAPDPRKRYPPELMRRFEVYFKPCGDEKGMAVRDVKANQVGKLITIKGVVIRATEVKPIASVITYTCDTCGSETYQPVNGPTFLPVSNCPSQECVANRANGRLQMQVRGSKFLKFQELRIQEDSEQVPVGSIPRSLTVLCKGENTRLASPGDHVRITGVLLPLLKPGFGQMQGLLSEVFLEVQHLETLGGAENDALDADEELTEEEIERAAADDFYDQLAASIAPEIFGHCDIKKSLLLQLVSGVDRNAGGMKIRGAINICLMGDPGVAKSQLLSYIDRLAPRSQYTTGRGSSGVGLTAAVTRDTLTGEWALEGGALVLADGGICCIDEFDKMMEADRTSIHEVMEQQTISIAKAGILTSLNARVAILAAANPAYGRYNPRKTIEQNIQLPAALLSRFDLLWLIQDKPDREKDLKLAEHITYVHAHPKEPVRVDAVQPFDTSFIRKYVSICKQKTPMVPETMTGQFVDFYTELRRDARTNSNTTFTSPRTLLACIRLSTALARLQLRDTVLDSDIREACRLMQVSKTSLNPEQEARLRQQKPTERAYAVLRDMLHSLEEGAPAELPMEEARIKCISKGLNDAAFDECLQVYSETGILMVNRKRTKIIFTGLY